MGAGDRESPMPFEASFIHQSSFTNLQSSMRIRVVWEGKTKDASLRALQADLARRIEHFTPIRVEEIPPSERADPGRQAQLTPAERALLKKVQGSVKVVLDPRGREWSSEEFAEWLGQQTLRGTRELAFLVGGPDGFSESFRRQADILLALSRMTFTRDWARALLLEQIYRAFTILRGYPYAR